jgi:hypothetical protein
MEQQTRSSPHAQRHDAADGSPRRPSDGSRRRLGLAIVAVAAVATAGAILLALHELAGS